MRLCDAVAVYRTYATVCARICMYNMLLRFPFKTRSGFSDTYKVNEEKKKVKLLTGQVLGGAHRSEWVVFRTAATSM